MSPYNKTEKVDFDADAIVKEIVEKTADFESNSSTFYNQHQEITDYYRNIIRTAPSKKNKGISSAVVSEITKATETLSTIFWKMLTAQDPNFYLLPSRPNVTEEELAVLTHLYVDQDRNIKFKPNLLRGLRTLTLFGGLFSDEHWEQGYGLDGKVDWEATGFRPRSFLEVAFDRTAQNPNEGDWILTMDFLSSQRLMEMVDNDKSGVWSKKAIEACAYETEGNIPARVKERLSTAGYQGNLTGVKEALVYRGKLKALKDNSEVIAVVLNRKHLAKIHKNRLPHRMIRYTGFIELENEPLGYGVGRLGLNLQRDIAITRNRVFQTIQFHLFNIWLKSRSANIKDEDMQIKPWNTIDTDDMNGLQALRPDIAAATVGMNLEEKMKEDFRQMTAATSNLQAQVTDATAREVVLAQSESVRRVSTFGELLGESLIRDRLQTNHFNNQLLLDGDVWVTYGGQVPLRLPYRTLEKKVSFRAKILTDKDFTPTRIRRLIEFLQIVVSDKNQFGLNQIDTTPIIKEIARAFEIDWNSLIRPAPQMGQQEALQKAQMLAEQAGLQGGNTVPQTNSSGIGNTDQQALSAFNLPTTSGLASGVA